MGTPEQPGEPAPSARALGNLSSASDQTARNRSRLRASEEALTSGVIEFQLARRRIGMASVGATEPLTPREQEVARLVAAGRTDGEIADELFISKKTASVHVANIKAKVGAATRVEMAMIVSHLGLGHPAAASISEAGDRQDGSRRAVVCPFKGLAAFDVADAEFFFGRERIVAELIAKLAGSTFLGVVGPSGTGKSSVVRAGLIPALHDGVLPGSEHWRVAVMRPGESPAHEVVHVMSRVVPEAAEGAAPDAGYEERLDRLPDGVRLVLVVDQFEELFTICRDEAERSKFIRMLVDLVRDPPARVLVVLTVRADFYGRCGEYRDLADMLGSSNVLVGPLTSDELSRAVELPARAGGLRAEPELVSALVRDVLDQPGGLPLLATTLLELWLRRDGRTLRLEAYARIGGVAGAVARLSEAAFGRLTPEQQRIARTLFLRLATRGDGSVTVRRRAPIHELDADHDPAILPVLAVLTEARLLTVDDGFVELAHEALLGEWPRMREWLTDDADGHRIREHLSHAAEEWDATGHDPGELYRGARLVAALEWSAGHDDEVNALERRYLAQSRAATEREITVQRRANRRLRGLLTAAAGLLVVATGTGAVALSQANLARDRAALAAQNEAEAEMARQNAEAATQFARSRELAASAVSVLDEDPALSKLLAVAAGDVGPLDLVIESALHQSWLADATIATYTAPSDEPIEGLVADLHPDGRLVVTTGGGAGGGPDTQRGSLRVVDMGSGAALWQYRPELPSAAVGPAFFSTDGTRVIAGVFWAPDEGDTAERPPQGALGVLIWDARTGRIVDRLDTGPCGSRIVGVSDTVALTLPVPSGPNATPDCYAGDSDGAMETIDLASGARISLSGHSFGDGALSRDGRYAGFTDFDTDQVVVLEIASGRRVMAFPPSAFVQRDKFVRAMSADGSLLLYGDRPILVIEVATGRVVAELSAGEGESYGAGFGPSGSLAYTSGRDATVRIWDAESGDLMFEAPGVGGGRPSASLDGRVLVTDFGSNTATLVHARTRGELGTVETCRGFVLAGTLEVVEDVAAFTSNCGDERPSFTIDLPSRTVMTTTPNAEGQDLAMSPDGARFARQIAIDDVMRPLQIQDVATGRVLVEMEGLCRWDLALPPPRIEPGPCRAFPQPPFGLYNISIEFSPDARLLAAVDHAGYEGYVAIWDAATGKLVSALTEIPAVAWAIAFTPDGSELIISTTDGELIAVSTESWRIDRRQMLDASIEDRGQMGLAGFLADGATLIGVSGFAGTGGGSLHRIDLETLTVRNSNRAHDGAPKSLAISPNGAFVATGSADGQVRVWEGHTGTLLHEFTVTGQAQGVAFIGNDQLAVTPQSGDMLIISIDTRVLLDVVRDSLTRSFTAEECERFGFDDECPSLEELRVREVP